MLSQPPLLIAQKMPRLLLLVFIGSNKRSCEIVLCFVTQISDLLPDLGGQSESLTPPQSSGVLSWANKNICLCPVPISHLFCPDFKYEHHFSSHMQNLHLDTISNVKIDEDVTACCSQEYQGWTLRLVQVENDLVQEGF